MYNHASENYQSPFVRLTEKTEVDGVSAYAGDVIYQDENVTAFTASRTEEKNQGNVLIVPNEPHENLYDIPEDLLAKIHTLSKRVALAMKEAYGCDGVSLRQHNEPAGSQEVFHYHLHVIPRYEGDDLYSHYNERWEVEPEVRAKYAAQLRALLN